MSLLIAGFPIGLMAQKASSWSRKAKKETKRHATRGSCPTFPAEEARSPGARGGAGVHSI